MQIIFIPPKISFHCHPVWTGNTTLSTMGKSAEKFWIGRSWLVGAGRLLRNLQVTCAWNFLR